jgi:hypothetical protein
LLKALTHFCGLFRMTIILWFSKHVVVSALCDSLIWIEILIKNLRGLPFSIIFIEIQLPSYMIVLWNFVHFFLSFWKVLWASLAQLEMLFLVKWFLFVLNSSNFLLQNFNLVFKVRNITSIDWFAHWSSRRWIWVIWWGHHIVNFNLGRTNIDFKRTYLLKRF